MVPEEWRADIHTHSTASDGSLTPQELIQKALEAGLQGLSITDHDTIAAYDHLEVPESLQLLPGIELSSQHKQDNIHILGYGFDPQNILLREACKLRSAARRERYLEMRSNLRNLGLPLPAEIVIPDTSLGRPALAEELLRLGIVRTFQEAFLRYLSEDSPAYVPGIPFTTEDTVSLLHQAGAWVILAHPQLLKPRLHEWVWTLPIDGVEGYYSLRGGPLEPWVAKAKRKGLLVTGGSDYHGAAKAQIHLGCSWTPQEVFDQLKRGKPICNS